MESCGCKASVNSTGRGVAAPPSSNARSTEVMVAPDTSSAMPGRKKIENESVATFDSKRLP